MTTRADNRPLRLLVMEGDGIGPEITAATLRVLEAVDRKLGLGLVVETTPVGFTALRQVGTTFPEAALSKAKQADGIIFAPLSHLDHPPAAEGASTLPASCAGGLGLAASINYGAEHGVAQAQHGSAPDIAGQDRANPASLIGSAAMLLARLAERRGDERLRRAGSSIDDALDRVLADPSRRTVDLGGPLGTSAFTDEVVNAIG